MAEKDVYEKMELKTSELHSRIDNVHTELVDHKIIMVESLAIIKADLRQIKEQLGAGKTFARQLILKIIAYGCTSGFGALLVYICFKK